MKQSFILSALVLALAGCSQLPEQAPAPISEVSEPVVVVEPELVENEVLNDHVAQAQATDFGHIFIDRDMSFIGTLPCEGCPGVKYHVNLFQDGKFEARQEFTGKLKTAIRNGTLNEELLSEPSEGYMRKGGSPQGWRSAVNTAIAQSSVS